MKIRTILVLLIISGYLAEPQEQTVRCHKRKGQLDDSDGRSTKTCYGSGTSAKALPG